MDTEGLLGGKNIVVTGAAQGIGKAILERVLAMGGYVVAVDLNEAGLQSLVQQSGADKVLAFAGNVADPEFAQDVVRRAATRFSELHGLVNNAGITRPAMIEKMEPNAWKEVIEVHLSGSFYFLQAVGRHMLSRPADASGTRGSIVNISSDAGRRGTIGQINYSAAKAGVFGLTMSAAREWGKHGIRANTVNFGIVETPMTETIRGDRFKAQFLAQIPMNRWSTPEEVAKPVCFLLSDDASYITGQHLSVNGGYTIGL